MHHDATGLVGADPRFRPFGDRSRIGARKEFCVVGALMLGEELFERGSIQEGIDARDLREWQRGLCGCRHGSHQERATEWTTVATIRARLPLSALGSSTHSSPT